MSNKIIDSNYSFAFTSLDCQPDNDLVDFANGYDEEIGTDYASLHNEETHLAVQIINNLTKGGMSFAQAIILTISYANAIENQFLN